MLEKKIVRALLCLVAALSFSAPGASGAEILCIVSDPTLAAFPNDALLGDFFKSLGHTVTYFDDNAAEAAMEAAAAAADLVWISESVGSGNVANKITEIATPMIVGEPYAWDEMGMSLVAGITTDVATTDITIVKPGHFLAGGLSGTVPVLSNIKGSAGTAQFAHGRTGPEGTVIATATLADGQTYDALLVYDKGAKLAVPPANGSPQVAADTRIGMFFHYYAYDVLNENAYALIRAAVRYALGSVPQARNPNPADRAIVSATWTEMKWSPGDFAVSHDVYLGENFDDVNSGAASTFRGNQASTTLLVGLGLPGDPYPGGLVPGTTYYWRIDEVNIAEPNSPWKGAVWSFSIPPKTAYNPNPAEGAEFANLNTKLTWTAGFGAKLHTIYLGGSFDDVNNATTGGAVAGTTTYSPPSLKSGQVYYWRVDEVDPPNTYKGQVWSFTTVGAVGKPYPSNGNASAEMNAILSWTPSASAASHQVYFGTDKEAVRKAGTTSPEYKGVRALGAESYDPGLLPWDSTYYWRVDEVNNVNASSPWKGPLWSFTTGQYLLVEDFESYNDIDLPAAGSNRIFDKWIDGFLTPATNGAVVGNNLPPYAERTIVHGGVQSMPYSYDTNLKSSEATLTLASTRNWTAQGVTSLSLWIRGASTNAAVRMYVALNGTAAVYHDNPTATQRAGWTQWVIPLQAFADQGVPLANVTSITIGFGTKGSTTTPGGTGKMYFDDLRLYR